MGVPDSSYTNLKNSSTQTLQINVCKVFPCLFPIMTEYADPAWCPFGNSSRGFFNPVRSFSYVSDAPHTPGEYPVHSTTNNTARLCSRLWQSLCNSKSGLKTGFFFMIISSSGNLIQRYARKNTQVSFFCFGCVYGRITSNDQKRSSRSNF